MGGNTSKRNLHKLPLVQNFAARVVLGLRKFDHISQGQRSLGWLDVTEKILFNDWILAFKCVNGLAPDYLIKYFIKRSAVHDRNTKECNIIVLWFPDVNCQQDKVGFTTGAQGNGMR